MKCVVLHNIDFMHSWSRYGANGTAQWSCVSGYTARGQRSVSIELVSEAAQLQLNECPSQRRRQVR